MPITSSEYFAFFTIVALGTLLTRSLPFLLFPERKEIPKIMKYLSDVLPYTMIGILVIYCLKDLSFTTTSYGLPELISIAVIILLHLWKKNTLISIGVGTILYMFLVQKIF